jgi:hypothetical protein
MDTETLIPKEAEAILPVDAVNLIKGEGYHITKSVTALKVTNEDQYRQAVELGTANKRVLNNIESFRKAIVKPINDQVKNINGMFKQIATRFQKNDELLRTGIFRYQSSRKKTESIQNVNTDTGRATIQERWDYEIEDESLIPRKWLCPDETKIGRAVRSGTIEKIPGVKIFKKKVTAFVA